MDRKIDNDPKALPRYSNAHQQRGGQYCKTQRKGPKKARSKAEWAPATFDESREWLLSLAKESNVGGSSVVFPSSLEA
jgi:hypothetical protein